MSDAGTSGRRSLQIMVMVSLAAMLLGTVTFIASGDPGSDTLAKDELVERTFSAPSWDPQGRSVAIKMFGPANYTFLVDGEVPESMVTNLEASNGTFGVVPAGKFHFFETDVAPGQTMTITVGSTSEDVLVVSTKESAPTLSSVGLALVAFGLLGFVFYKFGMGRSTA